MIEEASRGTLVCDGQWSSQAVRKRVCEDNPALFRVGLRVFVVRWATRRRRGVAANGADRELESGRDCSAELRVRC